MEPQLVSEEFELLLEDYKIQVQAQVNSLKNRIDGLSDLIFKRHNYQKFYEINERIETMEKGIVVLKKKQENDVKMQSRYINCCTTQTSIAIMLLTFIFIGNTFKN